MTSQVLITGASGFIGRRLLREGDRALVRSTIPFPRSIVGDLLAPATLHLACEGVDTIFHCAGYAHVNPLTNANMHWRINFEGTHNLITAAGKEGVRCFVFTSSIAAMAPSGIACADEDWPGEPVSPYGWSKRAAEDAVLDAGAKYGMHVVIIRPTLVYGRGGKGNFERMVRGIRAGWFPPLPETNNRRSLVHVEDLVAAMRLVANRPEASGRIYIVTNPVTYSGREIFDAVRAALGKPALRWSVPVDVFRAVRCLNSRASKIVDRLLGSACYSPLRIERELGWRASIRLAEGLREMLG